MTTCSPLSWCVTIYNSTTLLYYIIFAGTIYLPFDPILLQSINNEFILHCIDGVDIDDKHRGLSKIIYKYINYNIFYSCLTSY